MIHPARWVVLSAFVITGCGSIDSQEVQLYSQPVLGGLVAGGQISIPEGTAVGVRVMAFEEGDSIDASDVKYSVESDVAMIEEVTVTPYGSEHGGWQYLIVAGTKVGTTAIVGEVDLYSGEVRIPVTVTAQPEPP
jgi:hypothetical protein